MMNLQKFTLKNLSSNRPTLIASFIGLFLVSIGISLLVFSLISPKGASNLVNSIVQKARVDLTAPKVAECPTNGMKYTKAEENIWNTRRPITAMIENNIEARPESGLSKADVVYEAVAEGGITRFMSVFYCGAAAQDVKAAPIRSARVYFVNMAAGYGTNPIYLHQGGANDFCSSCPGGVKPRGDIDKMVDAYALLDKLGWRNGSQGNDMDGGFNIGYPIVVRDQYRLSSTPAAWEHSVVADLDEVYKEAQKRGFEYKDKNGSPWTTGFKKWTFQDGKPSSSPSASDIKVSFWNNQPDYDVEWKYDSSTNSYLRFNGGTPHVDAEFDKPQLAFKNVVIMFAQEKGPVDSEKHMFYQVIGTGKAIIFQNGQAITGTWSKTSALDREVFYDDNRGVISMVRGQTWVEIVPAGNTINY
ncbi:MAG TPA: DUF3048 domain-containing protein [Patescibacteria group bacterium]|nr:DUF3048 domain-containing protein [Patescibacteria group bacterium]